MLKQTNDCCIWQGVTSKPIATNSVKSSQVLHALPRSFDHFMKIAVHVKSGVFDWSESPSSDSRQFTGHCHVKHSESYFQSYWC